MYPVFSPLQAFAFWLDFLMLPWKMMIAPAAGSLTEAAASTNPASVVGLDPVSPQEIGTSATDFSTEAEEPALAARTSQSAPESEEDRTRVAGGQDHEVGYRARKSNTSRAAVKKAAKKVGDSRKKGKRRRGR